jgi:hypothetical protein
MLKSLACNAQPNLASTGAAPRRVVSRRAMAFPGASFARSRVRGVVVFLLYILVFAGCAIRIREAFRHNPVDQLWSDPGRHWEHATETLGTAPLIQLDPPIYQMWVSLVQKWSLGDPFLIACYAGLLSSATPWLWYRFLRESLRQRDLALLGWALFAWLPSWISIFSYFMTETLFLALLGASLWQTMRARRRRSLSSFYGMVALWTVTSLTRGIAAPFAAIACLWIWLRDPRVRTAAVSVVLIGAMTVPFSIRNHNFLTLWSPLGSGWPNQIYAASGKQGIVFNMVRDGAAWNYGFASPSYFAKQLDPISNWEPKRVGNLTVFADLRKGSQDWRVAYERGTLHGWRLFKLRMENVVLVMFGKSWPDSSPDCFGTRAAIAMRWVWAPLFLLTMAMALLRFRSTLARPLLPALIAAWFVFQGVTLIAVNEGRYRKPLEGLLVAQCLVLVDGKLSSRRSRVIPSSAVRT